MAEYSIYIDAAGSKKDNEQVRNINALFPYDSTKYRTISSLTRRDGIWCSAGGNSQSVDMEVYDQLLDGNTVIKTSNTATCKTYGRGPNLTSSGSSTNENYATTTFSNWTQKESNAAVAAWQAGTLAIKRFVTITDYTSPGHGSPVFRDGYYSDEITIKGQDMPFTNYGPSISVFDVFRSDDGETENPESTTVYARIKLSMLDSKGLSDNPKLLVYYEKEKNPTTASQFKNIKDNFGLALNTEKTIRLPDTWSNGASWRFMLYFSAGEEVAPAATDSASRARVPLFISDTNNGVAIGQYSTATESQSKFESRWTGYFYNGIANIQAGNTNGEAVAAKSYTDVAITFARPFASAPNVVVGFSTQTSGYKMGGLSCSARDVTDTGFTIRVFNSTDEDRTPSEQWIAVGVPK